MEKTDQGQYRIRGWFLFTALIAAVCLFRLAVIGEASNRSIFLGYSMSRLLMMVVCLSGIIAGFIGFLDPDKKWSRFVSSIAKRPQWKTALTVLFLAFSLGWIVGGFLSDESFRPVFERMQPLLLLAAAVTGSGSLLLASLNSSADRINSDSISIRNVCILYFLIGCGLYIFIRLTGVGIVPDEMDWQPTGMTIQYWEILLSAWIALAVSLLLRVINAFKNQALTTGIIFFVIW